jgi:hypothetical protein
MRQPSRISSASVPDFGFAPSTMRDPYTTAHPEKPSAYDIVKYFSKSPVTVSLCPNPVKLAAAIHHGGHGEHGVGICIRSQTRLSTIARFSQTRSFHHL